MYESKRAGDFKIFPKIIKKQIKEGEGYDKPKDFAKVTLKVFALACRCKAGTCQIPSDFLPADLEENRKNRPCQPWLTMGFATFKAPRYLIS